MRVTVESLTALGACDSQVGVFAAEWPDGVELTRAVLVRAAWYSLPRTWRARRRYSAKRCGCMLRGRQQATLNASSQNSEAWW